MNSPRLSTLASLLMLYGSRLAGVLVSVLFLPLFARLLGPQQFGIVALILSTQAMLIMLDLGMSALLGRDIAAASPGSRAGLRQWLQAEHLLSLGFVTLGLPTIAAALVLAPGMWLETLLSLALFWAVVLQNLSQAAMVSQRAYAPAGMIQAVGVLLRALGSAATLLYLAPTLLGFILSQLIGALLHLAVNRHFCRRALTPRIPLEDDQIPTAAAAPLLNLARRGLPLFLMGIAGAAVLQLDKLIVGALMGAQAVSPYFLATTFCMVPIALLATPVAQFFQPQIIRALSSDDAPLLQRKSRQLTLALLVCVVLPSCTIWFWREALLQLWLRDSALATQVAGLVAIILPAAAIGAVGYVPVTLLSALQDFRFQAKLSALLTVLTLSGAAAAAAQGSLLLVCWTYLAYYGLLTLMLWLRAASFSGTAPAARSSASLAAGFSLVATAPLLLQGR